MNLYNELVKNNYSIIASNGYFSYENGIKPVIFKLNENIEYFKDLDVADKVIGKASAMLLTLSKVKSVYAGVLSLSGKKVFDDYGIKYEYEQLTDYIINRKGDDMCPMEKIVKDIDDLNEAYEALNIKISNI